MALITTATITDKKSNWIISVKDLGHKGRIHINPNKLNHLANNKACQFNGCSNKIIKSRTSGLCDSHSKHQHSLLLELINPFGIPVGAPQHIDIVDNLIEWSKSRNYNLNPFFSALSFNALGNIPDVSTLASETIHMGYTPQNLSFYFNELMNTVNLFFPEFNNSSYQILETKKGEIPARILAITFAGLILCEEANRGDRWFNRIIRKNESKTKILGGAMPIGYYAAKSFEWGIEIGDSARNFVPK